MTHRRIAAAIAAIATLALAAPVPAEHKWKTVTLDGNPDFTISVPAKVGNYGGGKKSGDDLMFFSVTASGHGALTCIAWRTVYPKEAPREKFAAALATDRRTVFCKENGGTVSDVEIGGSTSFDHNGSAAAECTASYTDSAKTLPGRVESQMVIAAPGKAHFLTCISEDEDQDTAEYEWATLWEEVVRHVQKSFHLPK
jgi:hypothetical protein